MHTRFFTLAVALAVALTMSPARADEPALDPPDEQIGLPPMPNALTPRVWLPITVVKPWTPSLIRDCPYPAFPGTPCRFVWYGDGAQTVHVTVGGANNPTCPTLVSFLTQTDPQVPFTSIGSNGQMTITYPINGVGTVVAEFFKAGEVPNGIAVFVAWGCG